MIRTALIFAALLLCSLQAAAAPFINITKPSNNANFTAPADVTVTSTVLLTEDREGVTLHRIFRNGLQIASGGTKTVSTVVSGLAPGNYQVYSIVTTNMGVTKQSVPVNFTIVPPENVPPTVTMGNPTGAPFVAPVTVGLSVAASDPDGWITKVEYYRDGTLVGTTTTAPFTLSTTLYTAGTYSFHARVVDNSGAGVSSAAVPVTVAANTPPAVTITAPARGANYLTPTAINVEATASDSDGWVTRVVFYANGTMLGEDTAPPYTATWYTGDLGGPFTISAIAYDDKGVSGSGSTYVNLNSPNGSLTVNPKPCILASGDSCDTTVSWSSNDPAAQLWRHHDRWVTTQEGMTELRHFESVVGTGASGSGVFDVGGAKLNQYFQLKSGATLLAQQAASATHPAWTTLTSPSAGQLYQAPATVVVSATVTDPDQDPIAKVDFYADGVLISSDTVAPYTANWVSSVPGTHTIAAQAFDIYGAARPPVSAPVDINAQPSVSLTSPVNGVVMLPGEVVTLAANAADGDGTVTRVEFYADGGLIGTDTTAPFEAIWVPAVAKAYALTAVAYDNRGGSTNSAAHSLVINGPPSIRLVAPAAGELIKLGETMTLSAEAHDVEGVSKVEFFVDEALVGTATLAPYALQWSPSALGVRRISAKATDIHGFTATSTPRALAVVPTGAVLRRYVYDNNHLLCKRIEPETGATVVAYDGASNPAWSVGGLNLLNPSASSCSSDRATAYDSPGRVDRTYDARNRLKTLGFSDGNGSQSWTYTPDGLPETVVTFNDNGATSVTNAYAYNTRRILTDETLVQAGQPSRSFGYRYNANGHLSAHVYPSGLAVDYSPNALGQARQAGSFAQAVHYYPNGAIKQFVYGNGITHYMERNPRGIPRRSLDMLGGTAVLDDTYRYDHNGNVLAITDGLSGARGNRDMAYDGLDRLRAVMSPMFGTDPLIEYDYDAQDNLIEKRGGGKILGYYYDSRNQLTNITEGGTVGAVGYDAQGNVANYSGRTYAFDFGNRLRTVTGGIRYAYDAHGRRVAEAANGSVRRFFYGSDGALRSGDSGDFASSQQYIHLAGSLIAQYSAEGQTEYFHTDALGSPIAITDAQGFVTRRTEYAPYGEALNGAPSDGPGFTGHVSDASTGLTYMQQRYYDPGIGRFLSVDPVAADGGTGANFNRYKYASNNPYKFTDPDGRADRVLFNQDDALYAAGKTFEMPGYYSVVGHSWQGAYAVDQSSDRTGYRLDADVLVRTSPGLKQGQGVFLGQCGVGGTGYAQSVANANKGPVLAAMGYVMYPSTVSNDARPAYKDGDPVTLTVNTKADGTGAQSIFRTFAPGGNGPIGAAIKSITYNPNSNKVSIKYAEAETGSHIKRTEVINLDKKK